MKGYNFQEKWTEVLQQSGNKTTGIKQVQIFSLTDELMGKWEENVTIN